MGIVEKSWALQYLNLGKRNVSLKIPTKILVVLQHSVPTRYFPFASQEHILNCGIVSLQMGPETVL